MSVPFPVSTHSVPAPSRAPRDSGSCYAPETSAKSHDIPSDDGIERSTDKSTGKNVEKKTLSSSSELSFMAALLSSLVNTRPAFAVSNDTEKGSAEPVPVKFGGTFNMDPSMLVLPEGVDAEALAALIQDNAGEFSSELLAALTPGVPYTQIARADLPENVLPVQGLTTGDDPRLIASGLTPADMQALIDHLKTLSAVKAEGVVKIDLPAPVATVAIVPDTVAAAQQFTFTTTTQTPVVTAAAVTQTAVQTPASTETAEDPELAATLAVLKATDDDEFDPLEFRLAMKPSRYSEKMYQTPAPVAQPVTVAGSTAASSDSIKGSVQVSGSSKTVDASAMLNTQADAAATSPLLVSDFDCILSATPLTPTPAQGSGLTNPVLQNVSAVQAHPATQALAAVIADRAKVTGSTAKTLAVQLDPPELGKLQLKMKYEKGEPLKVHVVLEKADTMAMFQRDAHALENALNQAGIKTDSSSLSFSLDQNAFQSALSSEGGSSDRHDARHSGRTVEDIEPAPLESRMQVFTDEKTGLVHYNILA